MRMTFWLVLLSAFNLMAQTNFDVLVCRNASYTNASIIRTTPAYAVVSFEGGLAKVAMTNLPDTLQKQFGYDPEKAAALLAAEEKHRLAVVKARADQARLIASLRGTNQTIQIKVVLDDYGQCQTSVGQIYAIGLPASVSEFLANYYQLKANIPTAEANAGQLMRDYKRADANAMTGASGDPAFVDAWMAQRQRAENMRVDAENAADEVKNMKSRLAEMQDNLIQNTSVVAYPTGLKYSGFQQWQCVGVAP